MFAGFLITSIMSKSKEMLWNFSANVSAKSNLNRYPPKSCFFLRVFFFFLVYFETLKHGYFKGSLLWSYFLLFLDWVLWMGRKLIKKLCLQNFSWRWNQINHNLDPLKKKELIRVKLGKFKVAEFPRIVVGMPSI